MLCQLSNSKSLNSIRCRLHSLSFISSYHKFNPVENSNFISSFILKQWLNSLLAGLEWSGFCFLLPLLPPSLNPSYCGERQVLGLMEKSLIWLYFPPFFLLLHWQKTVLTWMSSGLLLPTQFSSLLTLQMSTSWTWIPSPGESVSCNEYVLGSSFEM